MMAGISAVDVLVSWEISTLLIHGLLTSVFRTSSFFVYEIM